MPTSTTALSILPLDVFENDTHYLVRADVPGYEKSSVRVEVEHAKLRLQTDHARAELRFASEIDADEIDATLEHGVLELILPKSAAYQPRTITVN